MSKTARLLSLALAAQAVLAGSVALAAPDSKTPVPAAPGKSIVLVHGAFADGASWDKVIPLLQAKGYTVVAVHDPMSSLADDVAATTRLIDAQPGDVILVGHSYGGVVITEAGNDPKVKALVYVAAFVPDAGESINDLGKGQPPPAWAPSLKVDSGGFGSLPPDAIAKFFAPDLTPAEQKLVAATEGPLAMKSLDAKIKTAAWKTKPSWYVRAEDDKMIDPAGQAVMAKRANATTTSIKSSHVAMLSHPGDVAKVILAAAAAPAPAAK